MSPIPFSFAINRLQIIICQISMYSPSAIGQVFRNIASPDDTWYHRYDPLTVSFVQN